MVLLTRLLFYASMVLLPITLIGWFGGLRAYTFDLAFVPLMFVAVLAMAVSPRRLRFRWSSADSAMVFTLGAVLLSTLFSKDVLLSFSSVLDWLRYTLLYLLVRGMTANGWLHYRDVIRLWTFIGSVLVIVGLIQLIRGDRFGLISNYFGAGTAEGTTAHVNLQVVNRVSGTTPNANVFAMWLTVFWLLPLTYWLARRNYLRFMVVAGVVSLVILSTLARGAIVAFALSMLLLGYFYRRNLTRPTFILLVLIAVCILPLIFAWTTELGIDGIGDLLSARMDDARVDQDAAGRFETVRIGLIVAFSGMKEFLLGTGPDAFPRGLVVHNVWIKTLAEAGVLALIGVVWISFLLLRSVFRLRHIGGEHGLIWARYMAALLLPFLLICTQVYPTAGSYHLLIPLVVLLASVTSASQPVSVRRPATNAAWAPQLYAPSRQFRS